MTTLPTNTMPDLPAEFKREPNAKGITLSAGPVTATAKRTSVEAPVVKKDGVIAKAVKALTSKVPAVGPEKPATKAEVKAIKAKAPKFTGKRKEAAAPKPAKIVVTPIIDPLTGQPIVKVPRSIVPMRFKERYAKHNGTCGDDMALELKAATTMLNADKRETLDIEALWAVARANKLDVTKYLQLNNGQKRMNVGNKLRGLLAAGSDVTIGKRTFKAEDFKPRH